MSHSNLLQGYTWDAPYDDPQQFSRPIQDEVISVYEVYVKEETVGADGRSDISIISNEPGSSGQIIQVLEQNVNEENVVVYSHPMNEGPSATRLVDKDDPRSRLHFVKYLKRDGKTLKIWECGICSKEFRHQYTLMRHLPTHTDERNFKCEACGKAFRQLSTLSQHRAIHSDARPYVCEFCKKTFNRVSTLISHRKTHSEHKPHKCHLCGKGFHQKGNLRNHVFTHTNERPYKCELCGKGFNQMSNLMCHKVKAHAHAEKMQYVCGICGKEFPRRFSLRSHEEYKHGIKYRHSNAPVVLQDSNDSTAFRNKHVSIVPNGERPMIGDMDDKENVNPGAYAASILVDKIETKAMENAILEGQTPFALFKPAKGIPVLVKIGVASNRKQLLTPATAEDLRMAGKMTLSPTLAEVDGVKAVQIKVPVVATVTQRIEPDGNWSYLIEPPGPGQEQESLIEPIESNFSCLDQRELRCDVERNLQNRPSTSAAEDCTDLLELAAQGGIQFVRATEDGRYEVMTNSEARDLMAQNSHDVTILDGEDAEAISVVNLRQDPTPQNQEIIIGDPSNQITVLNSGGCNTSQKNVPTDAGIEVLGDKNIRILGSKSLDDRFANGMTIFDQDKIDDYTLGSKDYTIDGHMGILDQDSMITSSQQNLSTVLTNHIMHKSLQHSTYNSLHSKHQPGMSILNHNYQNMKQNHSLSDSISTIFGNEAEAKGHIIEFANKMRLTDFDTRDSSMETANLNTQIGQSEVKILGAKNNNKVKILGHSMDKTEIEKVLQLGNSASKENIKILGPRNSQCDLQAKLEQYNKDWKILNNYSYDQFSGSQAIADQRFPRREVKILGKKKDCFNPSSSYSSCNTANICRENTNTLRQLPGSSGFEVSKYEVGDESGKLPSKGIPGEPDSETYLSLLRINTWLRKSNC
ncbi:uncharacterized protein LOC105689158 isoform X2 [Athalia rosae]|uniref:uncharacterized protein LOC105689158 isoform X2 n=1 Tax=Athalia rosae TaxID=37344 RepID=UPI002034032D|nr:uncharacterized protein LOC105689158 isoform X2 [Athalia rosae]